MPGRGDFRHGHQRRLYTRADGGETRCLRDIEPPPVEWGRVYGENGLSLAQEAAWLLAEGFAPEEAARELVWRYGRQCEATGRELLEAAT